MNMNKDPMVTTQMMIRRSAGELYEAFVDPAITTKFWFTKSSGRLEPGAQVQWRWDMYGASAPVVVKDLEPGKRILIAWGEPPAPVEFVFEERNDGTLVTINTSGFTGDADQVLTGALDSMGGFTLVLAGAKAWLEHGIDLKLVADQHPDAHVS